MSQIQNLQVYMSKTYKDLQVYASKTLQDIIFKNQAINKGIQKNSV